MALFGYLYAFLQTTDSTQHERLFTYRQLLFGAHQELLAFNSSKINESFKQFIQIFGHNFEKMYDEFEHYLNKENKSNVYEFLKSISNNPCSDKQVVKNGTLFRYGRVCQVGDILHFAIKFDLFSRMYSGSIFETL